MLDRQSILAIQDRTTEEVQIPPWGGSVFVRSLSGEERDRMETTTVDANGKPRDRFRARFAVLVCSDKEGKALFTEEDVLSLAEKSAAALDIILQAGMRLNGIGADALEELEKN